MFTKCFSLKLKDVYYLSICYWVLSEIDLIVKNVIPCFSKPSFICYIFSYFLSPTIHLLGTVIPMLDAVTQVVPVERLAVHFHDTYGQALSNILVSLQVRSPFYTFCSEICFLDVYSGRFDHIMRTFVWCIVGAVSIQVF